MENPTSQPIPHQQSSEGNCWRKFKTFVAHLFRVDDEMRRNLSMVAALISTITFQVALNPPGGVVQTSTESSQTPFGCKYGYRVDDNTPLNSICTGQAVLASVDLGAYRAFIKYNTFSFGASLIAALLFVSGILLRHKPPTWLLSISMAASLTSLAITYIYGVFMVTPRPIFDETAVSLIKKLMWIWIGLLLLISLIISIRFLVWLVTLPQTIKRLWNEGNTLGNSQNNSA